MNHFIDARGMAVQQSWLLIMDSMKNTETGRVTTITDSLEKARHICEMARQCGVSAYLEESRGEYYIHINRTLLQEPDKSFPSQSTVVVITSSVLGRGDEALGKVLMKGFIYHMKNTRPYPRAIIFLNSGVTHTVEGSDVLADLRILSEQGVEILSSSTCLEYYGLKNKLAVGRAAGMKEITEKMQRGENTLIL